MNDYNGTVMQVLIVIDVLYVLLDNDELRGAVVARMVRVVSQ